MEEIRHSCLADNRCLHACISVSIILKYIPGYNSVCAEILAAGESLFECLCHYFIRHYFVQSNNDFLRLNLYMSISYPPCKTCLWHFDVFIYYGSFPLFYKYHYGQFFKTGRKASNTEECVCLFDSEYLFTEVWFLWVDAQNRTEAT